MGDPPVRKSDEEWREQLTPAQYEVLRRAGTEPPFTGEYTYNKDTGDYRCAACDAMLFSSGAKFDLALDWSLVGPFGRRVLRVTAEIPYGGVLSYAEVAADAGSPRAHRAAGNALGANPIPIVVPCHRVVRSGGVIGNYGGGPERKRFLLELEGALR
jgi:methylated-DNA-[protein]-cysteine S-methyltransferase